jgi:hypothetical protein
MRPASDRPPGQAVPCVRENRQPTAAQRAAWRKLWDYLLSPLPIEPETQHDAVAKPLAGRRDGAATEEAPRETRFPN